MYSHTLVRCGLAWTEIDTLMHLTSGTWCALSYLGRMPTPLLWYINARGHGFRSRMACRRALMYHRGRNA